MFARCDFSLKGAGGGSPSAHSFSANQEVQRRITSSLRAGSLGKWPSALTRACGDKDMRERVLGTTREYYLQTFAGPPPAPSGMRTVINATAEVER